MAGCPLAVAYAFGICAVPPICLGPAISLQYRFPITLQSSGVPHSKRMKQISYGKQRETKNSAPEIEIMTNAMLQPPMHPRKQAKRFADMSKDDKRQTSCTDQLQEGSHTLSTKEKNCGANEQHGHRRQPEQGNTQCGVHGHRCLKS